jgi:hypothetical protein
MHPLQVSAQFAAFVWFCDRHPGADKAEALRFARENWVPFLPAAHEGWGNLLIEVAKVRPAKGRRVRRRDTEPAQGQPITGMAVAN